MDLILSFLVFMAAMVLSLSTGVTMIVPLLVGLVGFTLVALRRGFHLRSIGKMCLHGMQESLVVVLVMLLIGCLTSLWRQTGTIAYFTYYGVKLIPPSVFILAAFLLTSVMSYALGTSFGVAGTIGVILMTIARASGVSLPLVGGAIMSGLYFGDRGSPAASSASLVANETHTDVSRNFRLMIKSSLLPMGVCIILYGILSIFSHPAGVDSGLLDSFAQEFRLSLWCLLPTIALLVPAFMGIKIKRIMAANIVISILLTRILQGTSIAEILRMTLLGYTPRSAELAPILSGGGVASMLEIVVLLLLSSGCAGIFEGTHMLAGIEGGLNKMSRHIGRFPAMVLTSLGVCAVFCNQTIGIIMCRQCMSRNYGDTPQERTAFMLDVENSVVPLAGMVPWCIASSVPLGMLGCNISALPFSAYLYLLPICWYFTLKFRAKKGRIAA